LYFTGTTGQAFSSLRPNALMHAKPDIDGYRLYQIVHECENVIPPHPHDLVEAI